MDFGWAEEHEQFRVEVREFIERHRTPELIEELGGEQWRSGRGPEEEKFRQALNEAGYSTLAWPEEYGGQAKGGFYSFILGEELGYWGLSPGNSMSMIGSTIMRFGSENQKQDWLPSIVAGEMTFALGYTEPNAGTDLASLQTRAVRDGDEWVINGQKIYTSDAHVSTHVWLAARTNPDAPKHRGISMFVVPMTTPGITVRPLWTMGDMRTNETFWEDVRVPADALVGEEDRGWYMATNALDLERVMSSNAAPVLRTYDDIVRYIIERRPELKQDSYTRAAIAEAKMDVEIARAPGDHQRHHHRQRDGADDGGVDGEGVGYGGAAPPHQPGHGPVRRLRRTPEAERRIRRPGGTDGVRIPHRGGPPLRRRHQRHPAPHHRHPRPRPAPRVGAPGAQRWISDSPRSRSC